MQCGNDEELIAFFYYIQYLMYKPFFLFYGIAHVAVGIVLALFPNVIDYVLTSSISNGAGVLLGFISALAGLGFTGCAFVRDTPTQLIIIRLCLVGNVLNFLAHAVNALRGDAPTYVLYLAAIAIGSMILALLVIGKKLRTANSQ